MIFSTNSINLYILTNNVSGITFLQHMGVLQNRVDKLLSHLEFAVKAILFHRMEMVLGEFI
ncbi:hypothetical protein [uncultured Aquimarina sp.]|uniref:hypothetical protein n=1 Tax=uncultured Aquimarina sp. TaxID=575652 RepID=UPI002616CE64|nr:hypothetical protein [uncultured Aquimarina sp.]